METSRIRFWTGTAIFVFFLGGAPLAPAQTTLLFPYDATWKYESSGTDLGTTWREPGFDDSTWASGAGVFSCPWYESLPLEAVAAGAAIRTDLSLADSAGERIRTYYFRTRFTLGPTPANVVLVFTNLVDDGAVFYVNGQEVHRENMPSNTIDYVTFATNAVEVSEGTSYFRVAPTNLVAGENVLAVEIHQVNLTSNDVVFGLRLGMYMVDPATIVMQPSDVEVEANQPFTLTASATGDELTYQWQKDDGTGDFVDIQSANGPTLSVSLASPIDAGSYRLLVTNILGSLTSRVARVQVVPDVTGPVILSAVAQAGFPPYLITVSFNEKVNFLSVRNTNQYTITEAGTGNMLVVSNAQYAGTSVHLTVSPWNPGSEYVLTVNDVRDNTPARNVIAPNSEVGVGFMLAQPLLNLDHWWRWNEAGIDLGTAWRTNLLEGTVYGEGQGVFGFEFNTLSPCLGDLRTLVSIGPMTHYFVTDFVAPPTVPNATLECRSQVDDGCVFYLNGVECGRYNMPDPPGEIGYYTLASTGIGDAQCVTNTFAVTNLLSGTNIMAVEIHQSTPTSNDVLFGLEMTGYLTRTYPLPESPPPRLQLERQDEDLRLEWNGGGYALQSATQLVGPWTEVQPDMSNPYLTAATNGVSRFWRLIKK